MNHRFVWPIVAVLLSLAGCHLPKVQHVKTPAAKVMGVRLIEQTPQGARFEVIVEMRNPNKTISLPLLSASFDLAVGSVPSTHFNDLPNRTLPAGGQQVVFLTAVFPLKDAANLAGANYTVDGSIAYQTPGEIRKLLTESHVPEFSASFEGKGTVQ